MIAKATDHPHRLFLLRHGNTDWSDSRKHTGRTDIPLNAAVSSTLCSLAQDLKVRRLPEYLSARFCACVAPANLPDSLNMPKYVHTLTEWDYGDYEGF
jgi:broad specificity phosphatase PhoE